MSDAIPAPLYALHESPGNGAGRGTDERTADGQSQALTPDLPAISVVIPMFNEEGNAASLVGEVAEALRDVAPFEIIVVDDCSRDRTLDVLQSLRGDFPELRILSHGRNAGQSRSLRTGILAARNAIIATLDGDGQNDPADMPTLYRQLLRAEAPALLVMVAGERTKRKDSQAKRVASSLANGIRKKLLQDNANDTGCGLKVFYRAAFLRLPYFDHLHRYLPALIRREGFSVEFTPVSHRLRMSGVSKYTNLQRMAVAIRDIMGVIWLIARSRQPGEIRELSSQKPS